MQPKRTRMFTLVLIFAAYLIAAFFKFNAFWQSPGFEKDQRTLFWTESAMHYYMAEKVANGGALGELDKRAQHPEGIVLNRDIAPAMPWIAGTLYKWIPAGPPLDIFISYLFILYSSLTVIAVYLWTNVIFKDSRAAAASAFLYAVSAPAFIRSVGAFIKEDLALPALMLGFYLLYTALDGRKTRAAAGGLCVSLALLSWHFSQFMLLCFSAILLAGLFVNGKLSRGQAHRLAVFTAILAAAALIFPMLRATAFIFSPAMAILYAILVHHFADNLQKTRRDALTCAVFIVSILIYFKSGLAEQSHVFRLFVDKIKFGFAKPADPTLLSYETRSNWIEDFNSPNLHFLFYAVSLFLPLGIFALAALIRKSLKERGNREAFFIAGFAAIFLVFFAMSRRMITVEIIFFAVAIGGLITPTNRRAKAALAAVLALTFLYEGWKSYKYNDPNPVAAYLARAFPERDLPQAYTVGEHLDALNWIRANTQTDDVVLASMGFSPVILAYAGRPIVIHSMFDAKEMRDKVQNYVESLYGSEEKFYQFVKDHGAAYVIYESKNLLMNGPNSDRYVAGNLNPAPDTAVFNLQFHPEKLKHFKLAYQNTAYRIYAVNRPVTPTKILPQPVYDERILLDDHAEQLISFLQKVRNQTLMGFQAGAAGNLPAAISLWEEVKREAPYTIDIHAQLCLGYLITKNIEAATANCQAQLELQPHSPTGRYNVALYYEQTAQFDKAKQELRTVLSIDPRYKKAAARLGAD